MIDELEWLRRERPAVAPPTAEAAAAARRALAQAMAGGRRPRRRVDRGRLAFAGMLAVAVAVAVVVVLVAAGGRRAPHPTATPDRSRQQLISILGVLRRPQTKADLNALRLPRLFERPIGAAIWRADMPLVRMAGVTPWGSRVFVIPVKHASPPPGRFRYTFAGEGLMVMSAPGGGSCCGSVARFAAQGEVEVSGSLGPGGRSLTEVLALLPDGVAKLGVYVPPQTFRLPPTPLILRGRVVVTRLRHGLHLLLPVHNNFVAYELHVGGLPESIRQIFTWYAPDGHVIKRFPG